MLPLRDAILMSIGEEQWKGSQGEWIKNLGRGSISCRGQDSLKTESVQPDSPPGEWLNDDENKSLLLVRFSSLVSLACFHIYAIPSSIPGSLFFVSKSLGAGLDYVSE